MRTDRAACLITSTSWTPDEDFPLLIEALTLYDGRARAAAVTDGPKLPKVVMLVTGKGPLRDKYMDEINQLEKLGRWTFVRCRSLWLEAADYPIILGLSPHPLAL